MEYVKNNWMTPSTYGINAALNLPPFDSLLAALNVPEQIPSWTTPSLQGLNALTGQNTTSNRKMLALMADLVAGYGIGKANKTAKVMNKALQMTPDMISRRDMVMQQLRNLIPKQYQESLYQQALPGLSVPEIVSFNVKNASGIINSLAKRMANVVGENELTGLGKYDPEISKMISKRFDIENILSKKNRHNWIYRGLLNE